MKLGFQKHYHKWFGKDVLCAITRYGMIRPGEQVCVALSGGKDSLTLLFVLQYLRRFCSLACDVSALHIKTGEYETDILRDVCAALHVEYLEEPLRFEQPAPEKNVCALCARLRRGAISQVVKQQGIQKVAYGHHADDVTETFFMNLVQNQKLGSFSPKVAYADNPMVLIRPLIYLEESTIRRIHQHVGLPVLEFRCPYASANIRQDYKHHLAQLNALFHTKGFSKKVVAALENLDATNIWSDLSVESPCEAAST
jgi:tRNA(Ile)-lysidine synthase TilS/MesJ